MRDAQDAIEARGARLVVVGNGAEPFARAFRDDLKLRATLLVDPELRAYRAAGLRRGRVEVLSPRLGWNAVRALSKGYRQTSVQGDPWQLGGTFVLWPDGRCTLRHASREAGDHAAVDDVLAALDPAAPEAPEEEGPSALARAAARALAKLVDPTIALSFSRPGFLLHAAGFDPEDLRVDLGGRRCLVTGANSGIGRETAAGLADLGAEVILLCRSRERGEAAAEEVRAATGNARVACELLDVSDLASVRRVGAALADTPVHALVHNAGVLPDARQTTADGLELTFATHVAGPYLLTRLLAESLRRAAGRVVFVSSGGMYTRRLSLEDPQWQARPYDGVIAYAETKRMQVVLAELWDEELGPAGVAVNAMHPGWADTPAVRSSLPTFHRLTAPWLRTPAEGADSVVWLCAAEAAARMRGAFVFDRAPRAKHLLPWTRESAADRGALRALCESFVDAPSASLGAAAGR